MYHGGVPTLKLTARALDALPLPSRGRVEYFDESLPGFAVRIFPSGRRVFTLLYRMKGGRDEEEGARRPRHLSAAYAGAGARPGHQAQGGDPARQGSASGARATPAYLSDAAVIAARRPDREAALRGVPDPPERRRQAPCRLDLAALPPAHDVEIVPAFGDRRAAAITRTEVREWSERLAEEKPVVANRAFAVMRRSYEWALGRDLVQSSPFVGIHKPAAEVPRDRVLSDDEIRAVFDALRHERPIIAALWELLFYTAVRPGTALAARWTHIDLPRKVWEVPVTKKARGSAEGTVSVFSTMGPLLFRSIPPRGPLRVTR